MIPVAVTRTIWDGVITPDERSCSLGQSQNGRLWDVLWMLRHAIRTHKGGDPSCLRFQLLIKHGEEPVATVTLKCICGPGDDAEPVLTVMGPDED